MTVKRSESPFNLCKFEYSDGRYCGLPVTPGFDGFCRSHGQLQKFQQRPPVEHNEDISGSLPAFATDPPTEEEVRSALAQVFRALGANRISTRRAATFGYLGQLMLTQQGNTRENRENLNNLSRLLAKTLDLSYNPKFGTHETRKVFRDKLSSNGGAKPGQLKAND